LGGLAAEIQKARFTKLVMVRVQIVRQAAVVDTEKMVHTRMSVHPLALPYNGKAPAHEAPELGLHIAAVRSDSQDLLDECIRESRLQVGLRQNRIQPTPEGYAGVVFVNVSPHCRMSEVGVAVTRNHSSEEWRQS